MQKEITSRDNDTVKYVCRLSASASFRAEEGLFFAEGKKLCFDLAASLPVRSVFYTEDFVNNCPEAADLAQDRYQIKDHVAEKMSETKTPQGLFCLFEIPTSGLAEMDANKGILLCENLQDPANVGAIIRSAAAFGFGGVVLSSGSADPFSPKALRACMGTVGRIPLLCKQDITKTAQELAQNGVMVYATALQNAVPLATATIQRPCALLIGSEGAGLSKAALEAAGQTVYIPMHYGVESLNAAAAASVLLYHFTMGLPVE